MRCFRGTFCGAVAHVKCCTQLEYGRLRHCRAAPERRQRRQRLRHYSAAADARQRPQTAMARRRRLLAAAALAFTAALVPLQAPRPRRTVSRYSEAVDEDTLLPSGDAAAPDTDRRPRNGNRQNQGGGRGRIIQLSNPVHKSNCRDASPPPLNHDLHVIELAYDTRLTG